jgi:hypothetical protein
MDRALRWIETLGGLAQAIAGMVRAGRAERVGEILPDHLLTELELARAEAEARARFGAEA